MSTEFAIAEVSTGRLNALVKNLMSQMGITDPNEAVRRVNSGEWVVSQPVRRWREENGVIYFSVTSTGMTGAEWVVWYKANGYDLGPEAEFMLRSSGFQPSAAGTKHEVAVLKGELFVDRDRYTSNIRAEVDRRGYKHGQDLNPEIVCLIRRMFSDEELKAMGLWAIINLHEPMSGSDGNPNLLGANRLGRGRRLCAYYDQPGSRWSREYGWAAVVPQAVPERSDDGQV